MASTVITSGRSSINEEPITEEELKAKQTPITTEDVLRLKKVTNGK